MTVAVGVGKSIWNPSTLSVSGTGAPRAAEVISATLTYGSLGTCQGGNIKTVGGGDIGCRAALWRVAMDGEGNVFAGIVDQTMHQGGDLADTSLLGPHRQTLEALGEQVGAPYPLQPALGVTAPPVGAHEKLLDVITTALDPYPTGDYGVGPDLKAALGRPEQAAPVYVDALQALSVKSLGYSVPDYVTDVVFDPGDGWDKFTYKRPAPDYVLRRTASANVTPNTVLQPYALVWTRQIILSAAWTAFAAPRNTIFADGEVRTYEGNVAGTGNPLRDIGVYTCELPADSGAARASDCKIRCAFVLHELNPDPDATNYSDPLLTITLLHGTDGAVGTFSMPIKKEHLLLNLVAAFDVPKAVMASGGDFRLEYMLDNFSTFRQVKMAFEPIATDYPREVPNLAGVVMPDGWAAPFSAGPIYEVKMRGWHIPPMHVIGLPSGVEQLAAGATITYNMQEATTTITTMAWPYAGQRRR